MVMHMLGVIVMHMLGVIGMDMLGVIGNGDGHAGGNWEW